MHTKTQNLREETHERSNKAQSSQQDVKLRTVEEKVEIELHSMHFNSHRSHSNFTSPDLRLPWLKCYKTNVVDARESIFSPAS